MNRTERRTESDRVARLHAAGAIRRRHRRHARESSWWLAGKYLGTDSTRALAAMEIT